ncbi:hypothetical protein HQ520_10800 [bacterium]|nr:hypothetical protein [bacterium]
MDLKMPKGLSPASRRLWRKFNDIYVLHEGQQAILLEGMRSFDRAEACRKQIDAQGLIVQDRFGADKANPLLATERDARAAYVGALRRLNMHVEEG